MYWGDDWPEVAEHLGPFAVDWISKLGQGRGEEFGDPEEILERLAALVLAKLDLGGPPKELIGLCGPVIHPERVGEFVRRLERNAKELALGSSASDEAQAVGVNVYPYRVEIDRLCEPLRGLYQELDQSLRRVVRSELTGLDLHTQPRLGRLTVCPFVSFGPPMDGSIDEFERWVVAFNVTMPSTMKNKFVVQWYFDLRDDPACRRIVSSIEGVEESILREAERMQLEMVEALTSGR